MNRRWVTIEWSRDNAETFAIPRLTKVVDGADGGGISSLHDWQGGGGFRVLEVAPSMFDICEGRIVLAPWATDEALAEAVAAQAGFDYSPDDAPFCGRKGRQRLAVIDGLVNPNVAELLVSWLAEDEVLVVYGTAVDPNTRDTLTTLRRGSQVRKVPQTILTAYRKAASRETMFTPPPILIAEGEGE
jgi:adenine-specific DNA-methyltransferase